MIIAPLFRAFIEENLKSSYPKAFFYYSQFLEWQHSQFIWTSLDAQIMPRTEEIELIFYLSTKGEMLDNPAEPIYLLELDSTETSLPAVGLL